MRKWLKILLSVLAAVLALVILAGAGLMWYDRNVDRSGWECRDGKYYYKDFYGSYISGWTKIGQGRYYFDPQDQSMVTYWQTIDGSRYYFSGDGTMDTGFWEIDGERYYFREDGTMATEWLAHESGTYYFDADGKMLTSWQEIDGKRYHFRDSGIMDTGLTDLDGFHYRFLEDGSLYTGWDVLREELVYYLPEGPRAVEWQEIDGKRYYFGLDGVMQTGWLIQGEYRYYLQEDGSAATSPTVIGGETYYFSPSGIHVVLVNEKNPVPGYYTMTLKTVVDWNQVSTVCYDALTRMLADMAAAGIEVTFNSAYRTVAQQKEILETRTEEYVADGMDYPRAYAKARETVALPGTSEHHLGLAVDLLGEEAIAWLHEHCWEYGFIVRYRAEKAHITGIIDEPWHFRYVGVEIAMELKESGLCLEEYLGAEPVGAP